MTTPNGRSLLTDGDEAAFQARLLAIARRTALEEGPEALSTVRLARDAGATRVAVERRFRNRGDLLAALQGDILGEAAAGLLDALGGMSPRRPPSRRLGGPRGPGQPGGRRRPGLKGSLYRPANRLFKFLHGPPRGLEDAP